MRIFIGSIAYQASADDVLEAFSGSGFELTGLQIFTDRETGQSRGFAFAECEDHRVIEHMTGESILGRRIVVNEAKPREQRAPKERAWKGESRENWHGRD